MERQYTIPLRREWIKTVRYKRAKKTIAAIRGFLVQHMKATDVKIGKHLNEEVWKHGIANPPSKIQVDCKKDKDGVVSVELVGIMKKSKPAAPKKQAKKAPAKKAEKTEAKSEDKAAEKKPAKDEKPAAKSTDKPKADAKAEKPKPAAKKAAKTE